MVTLQEYVDKMPAEQKFIYFAAGDSTDRLAKLPAAELVLDKGYDVLLLTEDVDEFCLQIMRSYPRKDAAKSKQAPSRHCSYQNSKRKKSVWKELLTV